MRRAAAAKSASAPPAAGRPNPDPDPGACHACTRSSDPSASMARTAADACGDWCPPGPAAGLLTAAAPAAAAAPASQGTRPTGRRPTKSHRCTGGTLNCARERPKPRVRKTMQQQVRFK